jgi:photosystem II stability/assembly factor-like uncharacterized protein
MSNGFPNGASDFLIDSRAPDVVYAAVGSGFEMQRGVFKSSDGGKFWAATSLSNATVTFLAQDARRGILFAGSNLGLFRSDDSGQNWTFHAFPGDQPIGVRALAIDPHFGVLYAATTKIGIQESLDGGQTWSAVGSGLTDVSVSDVALSSDGSILYAATNRGVYVFQFRRLRRAPLT